MAMNGDSSEALSPSKNGIDSEFKEKSSSGKSTDHHKHSSSKENSSERHKEHKKSKEHSSSHHSSSSSSKHHKSSKDSSKHQSSKSSSSNKEKSRDHSSSKSSSSHSNSTSNHKEHSKDKHKSREHKNEYKHQENNVESPDKHKSSSSSRDKHESKHHDNSSKKSDHSSHKHKSKEDKSSSHHHKEKDKTKGSDSGKDKEKLKSSEHVKIKTESPKVKSEPVEHNDNDAMESKNKIPEIKKEIKDSDDDDDIPLAHRKVKTEDSFKIKKEVKSPMKRKYEESDTDDEPLSKRIVKVKKDKFKDEKNKAKKRKPEIISPPESSKKKKNVKPPITTTTAKTAKKGKKEVEEPQVWKWWEEEKKDEGVKWTTLEHKGPLFAPPYERLPSDVKFYYDGKVMKLSEETEEVAGFYARMIEHDYSTKDVFNNNFFKDWRKIMTTEERSVITDLKKCTFKPINDYYKRKSEENKHRTKEQRLALKKKNEDIVAEYGFCTIDGHKEKIGNFRIEPPGLFRGRGEHPKMGKLKRRIVPSDIIINCGKDSEFPEAPDGKRWKEVRHDNKVTWLVSWTENIQAQTKYVMLNPSSKLKGEKDFQKYETARKLKKYVDSIRSTYRADLKSKEMKARQRAVALYFIDILALRAGNEKDDESADTVGCCSLRVEHINLYPERDGKEFVVEFDFLGKDSIRYLNSVSVEKRVYKNLEIFTENKQGEDDLFDRLNTTILNKYLNDLMEGLTAKVFRTFNASKTLQEQLDELTKEEMTIPEKILSYNRANRAVAILCNHQRAIPKTFDKQMENLQKKLDDKKDLIKTAKKEMKAAKNSNDRTLLEKKKKTLERLQDQLLKLDVQATDKEENKQIALGTSKLNYLDPRISVAWCKKWEVPIEKVYNKTQRDKFRWAIEMVGPEFQF
ncbi:DNA topoisomerase 1 [Nymphon striatum]|nr:DNA topoisomerase 1 [Nymphon striatum]